jgi:hypothetical protein
MTPGRDRAAQTPQRRVILPGGADVDLRGRPPKPACLLRDLPTAGRIAAARQERGRAMRQRRDHPRMNGNQVSLRVTARPRPGKAYPRPRAPIRRIPHAPRSRTRHPNPAAPTQRRRRQPPCTGRRDNGGAAVRHPRIAAGRDNRITKPDTRDPGHRRQPRSRSSSEARRRRCPPTTDGSSPAPAGQEPPRGDPIRSR